MYLPLLRWTFFQLIAEIRTAEILSSSLEKKAGVLRPSQLMASFVHPT